MTPVEKRASAELGTTSAEYRGRVRKPPYERFKYFIGRLFMGLGLIIQPIVCLPTHPWRFGRKLIVRIFADTNPWGYRVRRWETAAKITTDNGGCPIKCNIKAKGEHHAPWSKHYARTNVDLAKGERWFCSEAEARAAGGGRRIDRFASLRGLAQAEQFHAIGRRDDGGAGVQTLTRLNGHCFPPNHGPALLK